MSAQSAHAFLVDAASVHRVGGGDGDCGRRAGIPECVVQQAAGA